MQDAMQALTGNGVVRLGEGYGGVSSGPFGGASVLKLSGSNNGTATQPLRRPRADLG